MVCASSPVYGTLPVYVHDWCVLFAEKVQVVPGVSLLRSSPSAVAPPPLAGVGVGAGGVGALGPLCEGPAPSELGSWGSAGVGAGGGVEALFPLCEGPAAPELGSWGSGDMGVASRFVGGAVLAGGSVPYTGWGYCA